MGEEIANPRIVVSVEVATAIANLKSLGGSSADQAAKIESSLGSSLDNTNRRIKSLGDAISGSGATRKLDEVARAVEQLGGPMTLTSTQMENLRKRVEGLAAAGGTVPASLQGLPASFAAATTSAATLGQTIETQATAKLQSMAASTGPAGAALASLGPYGLAAAAALAITVGAAIGLTSTLKDATVAAVDYGGRLSDLSAKTGVSVESLQRFEQAGKLVGVSLESINSAAFKLGKALVTAPEKFDAIGLSAAKLRSLAPEEQLSAVAAALAAIEDPAVRDTMALELMGKKAEELMPFLTSGFKTAGDRAEALGNVMDAKTVAALDNVGDAATTLGETWKHLWLNIGAAVATTPGVVGSIDSVTNSIGRFSVRIKESDGDLRPWMSSLVEVATVGANSFIDAIERMVLAEKKLGPLRATATVGGFDKAAADDIKTAAERKKAYEDFNAVQKETRKLEAEYQEALAHTGTALETATAKIHASADAKRREISENERATAAQKAEQTALVTSTEAVQIATAKLASQRKLEKLATSEQTAADKLNAETLAAGMSPLQAKVAAIEGKRIAEVASALATVAAAEAEGGNTDAVRLSAAQHILAAAAVAKGKIALEEETQATKDATEAKKDQATLTKIADDAERTYAAALAKTKPTLENVIDELIAKGEAQKHEAEKTAAGVKDQKDANETLEEAKEKIDAATDALIELEKQKAKAAKWEGISDGLATAAQVAGGAMDIMAEFGVKADSELGKTFASLEGTLTHASNAASAFAKQDYVTAAIEGIKTAIDTVKTAINVASLFNESDSEHAMHVVGEMWGVEISDGLKQKLEEDADRLGDGLAAVYANLGGVFQDAGGVAAFGVERATMATRDLFSQLEQGKLSVEEVGTVFNDVFGEVAAENISKTTGLASAQLIELVAFAHESGIQSQALQGYLNAQSEAGMQGLSAFLQNATTTSQGAATVIGASIASAFDKYVAGGMTASEAIKKLQPDIDAFRKQLEEGGLKGGAAFDLLAQKSALFADEVTGPGFAAIQGLTAFMVSLHNTGQLTTEGFKGLTEQIGMTAEKLREQGVEGPALISALAPELQKIWELQHRYGLEVDATTQKLLDDAQAADLVGEKHMSAQDKMAAAAERTADAIEYLAERFGFLKAAIDATPSSKTTTVTTRYVTEGSPPSDNPGRNPKLEEPDPLLGLATGGGLPRTPGGHIIRFAENEYEWAVPQSKALDFSLATLQDAGGLTELAAAAGMGGRGAGEGLSNADVVAELQGLGRQLSTLDLLPSMIGRAVRASGQLAQ